MNGHVSLYKDQLSEDWIVDLDNGTRENPGRNREGFSSWDNADRAAHAYANGWKAQFGNCRSVRILAEHPRHVAARISAHHASAGVVA